MKSRDELLSMKVMTEWVSDDLPSTNCPWGATDQGFQRPPSSGRAAKHPTGLRTRPPLHITTRVTVSVWCRLLLKWSTHTSQNSTLDICCYASGCAVITLISTALVECDGGREGHKEKERERMEKRAGNRGDCHKCRLWSVKDEWR